MTEKKVWLITGAGRGLGVDIAKAAFNAGNFFAGFFEELSPEQVRNQIETLLFGPMNVTRAVLPVMRKQRSGLLLSISSTAGIAGQMFCTAYAAAKFGIEGWMESLTPEIAPFGIRTMLVEPGFFRTELLTNDSTTYAQPTIDDYAERTREISRDHDLADLFSTVARLVSGVARVAGPWPGRSSRSTGAR